MRLARDLARLSRSGPVERLIFDPTDKLARLVTGKGHLPPLSVRRNSGSPHTFETSAASVLGYVNGAVGVRPTDRILDVGCGSGAIALQLRDFLEEPGLYRGLDIHRPSIEWARRNIEARNSLFRFFLAELRNDRYNPSGSFSAESFRFPFDDASFSLILAKSLFTHLKPAEVENYMSEIARLLAPEGHCLMTFFFLTPQRDELVARGKSIAFPYGEGVWRYHDRDVPENAAAYRLAYVMELVEKHDLTLARPVLHGYQDVLLVRRPS
jgi:SAM-dependent methyltransferase